MLPKYCCAILQDPRGRLLLERRPASARRAPRQLTCFGGRREEGEDPQACIRRELLEELGLSPAETGPLARVVRLTAPGREIAWFYLGRSPARVRPLEPGVTAEFFTLRRARTHPDLSPWHRAVLQAFVAGDPIASGHTYAPVPMSKKPSNLASPASPAAPAPLMLSVSGCRGVLGSTLTPEVAARFASAFGSWVRSTQQGVDNPKAKPERRPLVVTARDGRAKSDVIHAAAIAGLRSVGCDALDLGIAMTPTVGFLVDDLGAQAGLMITASHNPQTWCGLKPVVLTPGEKTREGDAAASAPAKSVAEPIIDRFRNGPIDYCGWEGIADRCGDGDAAWRHAERVLGLMKDLGVLKKIRKSRFKVALDTVAGSARLHSPAFLDELGCRVTDLYPAGKHGDGVFPHTPEPLRENLTDLARATRKAKAAAGFAQDPDADRLALVDERGEYIGEEYTLVLAALALGELGMLKKGSTLVVNLSTSRMIEDVAAQFGCRVLRSAVGEANVVEMMKREGSPIGGEGNGGVIWPEVTYIRDSLSAMALVLALLAVRDATLSEVVKTIPSYAIVKRKVNLDAAINPAAVLERVAKANASRGPDRTDGVWVPFRDERAWLHVRASNTEPIMRLIAEAPTAKQAEALLDAAAGALR